MAHIPRGFEEAKPGVLCSGSRPSKAPRWLERGLGCVCGQANCWCLHRLFVHYLVVGVVPVMVCAISCSCKEDYGGWLFARAVVFVCHREPSDGPADEAAEPPEKHGARGLRRRRPGAHQE